MNVVIIDNDPMLVKSLGIVLETRGYRVITFTKPEEGHAYLSGGGKADFLIVDYVMPGLYGDHLLWSVKDKLPETCKVILISGHTGLVEPLDFQSLGVQAFIPKPLDLHRLFKELGAGEKNVVH